MFHQPQMIFKKNTRSLFMHGNDSDFNNEDNGKDNETDGNDKLLFNDKYHQSASSFDFRFTTDFKIEGTRGRTLEDRDELEAYILSCLVISESLRNLGAEMSGKAYDMTDVLVTATEWFKCPGTCKELGSLAFYAGIIEAHIDLDTSLVAHLQGFLNRPAQEAAKAAHIFKRMADKAH